MDESRGCRIANWSADLIGSHGHTVFHRPEEGWTLQIGHGATLYAELDIPVVCDLRSLMWLPAGRVRHWSPADRELFGKWDVALNLGGFANLSMDSPSRDPCGLGCGPCQPAAQSLVVQTVGLTMDMNGELSFRRNRFPSPVETMERGCLSTPNCTQEPGSGMVGAGSVAFGTSCIESTFVGRRLGHGCGLRQVGPLCATCRDVRVLVTGGGAFNPTLMAALRQATLDRDIELARVPTTRFGARQRGVGVCLARHCFGGSTSRTPCPASRALGRANFGRGGLEAFDPSSLRESPRRGLSYLRVAIEMTSMKDLLKAYENRAPEIVFAWQDGETEARGWVVINSLRGGAAGGVRG